MTRIFFLASGFLAAMVSAGVAQERQWTLDATDNQVFLVFGVPETDDVGLSFWCDIGKGTVSAYMPEPQVKLRDGERTRMVISIDGKATRLAGKAEKEQATGHFTVEAPFKLKDALMKKLRDGQSISVSIKGHATTYPLEDADFDGFVDGCNGVQQDD
jgi:hypothetical protein